jgi:hypothetical protein
MKILENPIDYIIVIFFTIYLSAVGYAVYDNNQKKTTEVEQHD